MHQIIYAITYAKSKEEALDCAEEIFTKLCEDQYPFDYYTLFNENDAPASGKARWGEMISVTLANSKEGKKLVNDGMKATRSSFYNNIKEVRSRLEKYTDKELFNEKDNDGMFKYYMHCAGSYEGHEIFLYDNDGAGIRNEKTLRNVLNKWDCLYKKEKSGNPHKNLNVYVIPCDVHY